MGTNIVYTAFKVGNDVYSVYSIKDGSVFNLREVSTTSGKLICTCQKFRKDNGCVHVELSKYLEKMPIITDKIAPSRILDSFRISPAGSITANILQNIGDISAATAIELAECRGVVKQHAGIFNVKRFYDEIRYAYEKTVPLNHPSVIKVGEAIKKIEPDFDVGLKFEADSKVTTKKPNKAWQGVKRPDPNYFYIAPEVWDQLCYAACTAKNILLTGPSGSGKSESAYLLAKAVGLPIEVFNFGAMSEPRAALIGNTHFSREKGTWFQKSRFVNAVTKPKGLVLLDEITRAVRGAFNILLPLLDRQGYLALDESEDAAIVHKGSKTCFIATANVGMEYTGTDALDKALKDRFSVIIDLGFPPTENEIQVLVNRCSIDDSIARQLVLIADDQRKLSDQGEFVEKISTRTLIEAGNQVFNGMDLKQAVKFCIVNHFSNEGSDESDRARFGQILQKHGLL